MWRGPGRFMFFQPREQAEALELRAKYAADATVLNGGTDLLVALNREAIHFRNVIDLSRVDGLSSIQRENGHWRLGGGATFAGISKLPIAALSRAAMTIGGPAIRNRGTIAGNLGTASPAGDGCVALLANDAIVELTHAARGSRSIAISDYFTGFRKTALLADELITAVRIPADWRTAWQKIGKRGSINISLVCGAGGVSPAGAVRLAYGCVAPIVIRAKSAEAIIERDGWSDGAIEAAAQAAMTDVAPIDDHRASATYRRSMVGVITRRLLKELRP